MSLVILAFASPSAAQVSQDDRSTPRPDRAQGGGVQADFDTLIELIQSTVAPETWEEVGGVGTIQGFPGGVYVDARGVMQPLQASTRERLERLWQADPFDVDHITSIRDLKAIRQLRKVSLTRLVECWHRQASAGQPTLDMRLFGGIQRMDYLAIDPETREVIVAGPADCVSQDGVGRLVGQRTGRPVLRLDDFLVLLKNACLGPGQFMCAITPRQQNLERTQDFLASGETIDSDGDRKQWLARLRDHVGYQMIEVQGVPAGSRVARRIVEADYHMKLLGLGLEDGPDGFTSYLEQLEPAAMAELGVLRWWFTLIERPLVALPDEQGYAFSRQVVQLNSENEFLAARGVRVHTGRAEPANANFARYFTAQYAQLADEYPVYADLDNLFRLAVAASVLRRELTKAADSLFQSLKEFTPPQARPAQEVLSVVNHRFIDAERFVAMVSGGVYCDTRRLDFSSISVTDPAAAAPQPNWWKRPPSVPAEAWWWD